MTSCGSDEKIEVNYDDMTAFEDDCGKYLSEMNGITIDFTIKEILHSELGYYNLVPNNTSRVNVLFENKPNVDAGDEIIVKITNTTILLGSYVITGDVLGINVKDENKVLKPATFSGSTKGTKFTITWMNYDETVLEVDRNVEAGTIPTYDGDTPTKPSSGDTTYRFIGWSPNISKVTKDTIYVAQFSDSVNSYTITWKNYDGSVLKTDNNISKGTNPSYTGTTPTRRGTAQYTYTFDGWTPELTAVTQDVTYTAKFKEEVNKYKITWISDGKAIETDTDVAYGDNPSFDGTTPTKVDPNNLYEYEFIGWNPTISSVTGDQKYNAVFKETKKTFSYGDTVTFDKIQYTFGTKATLITVTDEYSDYYNKKAVRLVVTMKNLGTSTFEPYMLFYEVYNPKGKSEDIGYMEYDDGIQYNDRLSRNTAKDYAIYIPYTADGVYSIVIEDSMLNSSIRANFTVPSPVINYTVSFDANGGTGSMTSVNKESGTSYTLPTSNFTAPTGKHFAGWSYTATGSIINTSSINITNNVTLFAIWEDETYTVSFDANGGDIAMDSIEGIRGEYTLPECDFEPPVGYKFKAWKVGNTEYAVGDTITVTGNTEVIAVWEENPIWTITLTDTFTDSNNKKWLKLTTYIRNNTENNVQVNSCEIRIRNDETGAIIKTLNYTNPLPAFVEPGLYTFFYEIIELDFEDAFVAYETVTTETITNLPPTYQTSNVQVKGNSDYTRVQVTGKVTNSTAKDAEKVCIVVHLYNNNYKMMCMLVGYVDNLAAGSTVDFVCDEIPNEFNISGSDVLTYIINAYEI